MWRSGSLSSCSYSNQVLSVLNNAEIMGLNSHTAAEIMTPTESVNVDDLILVRMAVSSSVQMLPVFLWGRTGHVLSQNTDADSFSAVRVC